MPWKRVMPPEAAEAAAPQPLILIVEDNDTNALIIGAMLRKHGFRTVVAPDGVAGAEMAAEIAPALVLMDLHMPRLDGFGAVSRIFANAGAASPPVVAVTANASPEVHAACLAAGFRAVLAKPLVLGELISVVRQFVAAA